MSYPRLHAALRPSRAVVSSYPTIPLLAGNLFTAPDDEGNAAWTKSAATPTLNATAAPDGTLTADLLVPITGSSTHFLQQGSTSASGNTATFVTYAKPGGYSIIGIREQFVTGEACVFALSGAGTVNNLGGGVASITLSNGWYRCAYTTVSTAANLGLGLYIQNANVDPTVSAFAGDGTSGVYLWHTQMTRP